MPVPLANLNIYLQGQLLNVDLSLLYPEDVLHWTLREHIEYVVKGAQPKTGTGLGILRWK